MLLLNGFNVEMEEKKMLQVDYVKDIRDVEKHLVDNLCGRSQFIVRLPHLQGLLFEIEYDYFINEITADFSGGEDYIDFIVCYENTDNILKSLVRKTLTTLSYIMYFTTNSIDETVKRLNTLELEEIIWCMIQDNVDEIFTYLYKKDELN